MSESDTPQNPSNGATEAQADDEAPQLRILAQYLKDLSFENPKAPDSLSSNQPSPKINVSVDVQAKRRTDEEFESDLKISVTADRDDGPAFIVELVYGGVFRLVNIPKEQVQPVVLIECPRMLFPFARRILADATRDGGFPPLMLDPIDFGALFRQHAEQQALEDDAQQQA